MTSYETIKQILTESPRSWLVTGAAGFIGSNLVLELLRGGQRVTDPQAETKYRTLEKYSRDLTQLAREEKLDPDERPDPKGRKRNDEMNLTQTPD